MSIWTSFDTRATGRWCRDHGACALIVRIGAIIILFWCLKTCPNYRVAWRGGHPAGIGQGVARYFPDSITALHRDRGNSDRGVTTPTEARQQRQRLATFLTASPLCTETEETPAEASKPRQRPDNSARDSAADLTAAPLRALHRDRKGVHKAT